MSKRGIRKLILMAGIILALGLTLTKGEADTKAASTYQIKVNKQANCVTIYRIDSSGKYQPVKAMVCSTGYATQSGTFYLGSKMRWHTLDGPCYGQYCSRIYGGVLFHSVWYTGYNNPGTLSVSSYNKLGTTASHGCVRLTTADAKWIYDNVPSGTPVIIYSSSEAGPLGKPAAIKVPYSVAWDPTDIWSSSNPWNKKKPSVSGASDAVVEYNSTYDARKGVTGRNTTGFDATSRIQVSVRYRGSSVKAVDTKKPGTYRVTYRLVDEIGRKVQQTVKVRVTGKLPEPKIKGVEDIYVNDADKLTKGRALKNVTVTQKGKELERKYVKVTYQKIKAGVYKVIYEAQNASEPVKETAKAYVDTKAPKFIGIEDGESYPVEAGTAVDEKYAKSLIGVSDNVSKLSVSDVEVKLTEEAAGYKVVYSVRDQAGNKTKVTIHLVTDASQAASAAAVGV